ncbi:hypothetical protein AX760_18950 [Pararhizobium antarcticum]|uniref:PAAR motif-containing protein n=2 Tax=Pararhizobium antarcticum TaxID=1798805 RepID=A0A657LQV6_9HYPH|nr:hypothetical protein AX761_23535 [Rhizobium sp. 58]OJF95617.1 hypothetical protein AX760_18950 [Pararhizobium antarcticum]
MIVVQPAAVAAETATPLPACALSGATSVRIGGQPALRLSDVVHCPPELYEIVPSLFIEGQPAVHFRAGSGDKGDCAARADPSVTMEGQAAPRLGDVACTTR